MAVETDALRVLRLFPDDCQPSEVERLAPQESFSGAMLWRLQAPRGLLCLRRYPHEHPSAERLEFIQAVLWHVVQEGFDQVPLPMETCHRHGYVRHSGALWELTPWLDGHANYRMHPSLPKLLNASQALAQFHSAAKSFPLPDCGPVPSPGIRERRERIVDLLGGRADEIRRAVGSQWPELIAPARRTLEMFGLLAPKVLPTLVSAASLAVPVQPCIRDVWSSHLLFVGDEVSGIVDFSAMRPENVAADIARLLGSMAGDDMLDWGRALEAYQKVRRLSPEERSLITAFDRSTVLLAPMQWLEWIYLENRQFARPAAVVARYGELVDRLTALAQSLSDQGLR